MSEAEGLNILLLLSLNDMHTLQELNWGTEDTAYVIILNIICMLPIASARCQIHGLIIVSLE